MIKCEILNKSFKTKDEMFKALKANKTDILELKKAQIQKSCEKNSSVIAKPLDLLKLSTQVKGIVVDDDHYYIATNTTKILDSHGDLHLNGIWENTVKQQQGKNYLVADHKLEMDKVIARKESVEMFTVMIPFALLGKDYEGETQALIYKVPKNKVINPLAKEWLDSGDDIEASVRMQYVKIEMALNSDSKDDIEEKKIYDNHIDEIANKADFDSIDYFFPVSEAKNLKESSLVINGSNGVTGQLESKYDQAALQALEKEEAASQALQDKMNYYKHKF